MTTAPGQGLLFAFAVSEGAAPAPEPEAPKPAKPSRRRWRDPTVPRQLEVVAPTSGVGTASLPPLPKTVADCRGPGICPVLRCSANLLINVVREGAAESITIGGRGGHGKGASISATQSGGRTQHGRLRREDLDRLTDNFADLVVARAEALPSTCLWDYVEDGDLIEGRADLESDEDDRSGREFAGHMTLEQVGAVLGMTRERIRQIELKALMRARTSDEAEELDPYFVPADTLARKPRR